MPLSLAGTEAVTVPSGRSSTPTSTSSPTSSASTMTLSSDSKASATAAGSSSQLVTLDTPMEDPPFAGFTNTGSPR